MNGFQWASTIVLITNGEQRIRPPPLLWDLKIKDLNGFFALRDLPVEVAGVYLRY